MITQSNAYSDNLEKGRLAMLIAPQSSAPDIDPVEEALSWHQGDPRATIETLLADCAFLRNQLLLASSAISHGMTRGWMPKVERAD